MHRLAAGLESQSDAGKYHGTEQALHNGISFNWNDMQTETFENLHIVSKNKSLSETKSPTIIIVIVITITCLLLLLFMLKNVL